MDANRIFLRSAVAVAIVATLAACGRRGSLEPPPGAAAVAEQSQKLPGQPNKQPERRFLLDALIE